MTAQQSLIQSSAYIDGHWIQGQNSFAVLNPATDAVITHVTDCSLGDVADAIEAADRALPLWKSMLVKDRAAILLRWRDLIVAHKDALAMIMTQEQGKPLKEALAEIGQGDAIEWSVEDAKRCYGEAIPSFKDNTQILVTKEPVGVVAAITPWNFPHSMITRKVAPALAAGCTVVLKPAQDTPLSALALAYLAEQAGVPKGVFNVVTCSSDNTEEVGKILSTHEKIRKISFTGSTQVGRLLMEQAAKSVKKVSLELGGNAPLIVFDSADLDRAVEGVIQNKFRNAGQTCICANRIFVQSGIYERFVAALQEKIKALTVGDGLDQAVSVGPLINKAAVDKVDGLVKDAKEKGASVLVGGQCVTADTQFYAPTLIEGMHKGMEAFTQEIFGPVAPLYKFETEDEVIGLANDTIYGLAAYFFSQDLGQCFRVARGLDYGMVGVNEIGLSSATIPFGGVKQSGLGREGGPNSLEEFIETKYALIGW